MCSQLARREQLVFFLGDDETSFTTLSILGPRFCTCCGLWNEPYFTYHVLDDVWHVYWSSHGGYALDHTSLKKRTQKQWPRLTGLQDHFSFTPPAGLPTPPHSFLHDLSAVYCARMYNYVIILL